MGENLVGRDFRQVLRQFAGRCVLERRVQMRAKIAEDFRRRHQYPAFEVFFLPSVCIAAIFCWNELDRDEGRRQRPW